MAEYDGLPLNTPTVIEDTADYTKTATRTVNGGTVQITAKAGSVGANVQDLQAKLAQLAADAATAQTQLQAIRNTAQVTFTTLALGQTAVQSLQTQMKTQAQIQQQVIQRLMALVKLYRGDVTDVSGT